MREVIHEKGKADSFPSSFTLARWQLREGWHLLLLTGLGMITAVMLVCSVPLYSRIALSAGLRAILRNTPDSTLITIRNPSIRLISPDEGDALTQDYDATLQDNLGDFLSQPVSSEFVQETEPLAITGFGQNNPQSPTYHIVLEGYDIAKATPYLHLTQGRLPRTQGNEIEIMLPVATANRLNIPLGARAMVEVPVEGSQDSIEQIPLHVVGIFEPVGAAGTFWHEGHFQFFKTGMPVSNDLYGFQALMANGAFVETAHAIINAQPEKFAEPVLLGSQVWYYTLDLTRLDAEHLDTLVKGLDDLEGTLPVTTNPIDDLRAYQNRIALIQVPVTVLLILITLMVLGFVSMISTLLVESRSESIAILRSRGASRQQIFGACIVQQVGLGLLVLVTGPLFALLTVTVLVKMTLTVNDQGALDLLSNNIFSILLSLSGYALLTVLTAVLTSILAIHRATRLDVLALRHQAAHNSQVPLWQRFYLDLFVALLALSGYGVALYETNMGNLDAQTQLLVLAPVILLTGSFTLLACLLLFTRMFPFLLEKAAFFAARSRSAVPTLALAYLTRASRQVISTTLLLALTTAFAVFTLVFTASQNQHVTDIATYQVGADFSGTITAEGETPSNLTNFYQRINGVLSASVGYVTSATAQDSTTVAIKAVDPQTFSRTVIWTEQYSTQPVTELMQDLQQHRDEAITRLRVPAIVDAATWDRFKLSPGQEFTLVNNMSGLGNGIKVAFIAMTKVQHIPTLSNGTNINGVSNEGVLVDYETYAYVYHAISKKNANQDQAASIGPNYFWLRSGDDPESLASIRTALDQAWQGSFAFYDRRAIINVLYHDPLYLDLLGVLALGAVTPLLLALVGSLIGSWLNIHHRLKNFTILRALGSAPRQILGMLAWEQGPIYVTLLALGVAAGWLLSAMTLPALVLISLNTQTALKALNSGQSLITPGDLPTTQMVVPPQAAIALVILLVTCLCALVLVIRSVARPVLSHVLRLGED